MERKTAIGLSSPSASTNAEPIHEFGLRCHYPDRSHYMDCPCVTYVGERQRPRCSKFNVALRTSECRDGTIYRAKACRALDPKR